MLNLVEQHSDQATILFFNDGPAFDLARASGFNCLKLPHSFRLSRPWQLWRAMRFIRNYIRQNQIELVHATMPYSHIVAFGATFGLRIKRVWFQHGPIGGLLDNIASLLPVDLICFNSRYLQKRHNRICPLSRRSKQEIIALGIKAIAAQEDRVQQIKAQLQADSDQLIIGMAGRICPWKGYEIFIKAVAALPPQYLSRAVFVIVGDVGRKRDSSYQEQLHRIAAQLTLPVVFIGHQSDLYNYLNAFDVLIHASIIPEPFGLVVAEAMLQHTLVIGSASGGIGDILQDQYTGLVFDPTGVHAVEQLRQRIELVIEATDDWKKEIKSNAYELIRRDYSVEQMTSCIEGLYRSL